MSAPLNEPAFPNTGNSNWGMDPSLGMTLRDWFAGQVLASASALPLGAGDCAHRAKVAYDQADAMLAVRDGVAPDAASSEPSWIERKVRKGTEEYRAYLTARFPRGMGAPSPFDFDGHKWSYHYTSFDDLGEFEVIHRPNPDASA